jgi:hypothetical protein
MSKTISFRKVRYIPVIKFSGMLNFDGFMKTLRNWIVNQGYEFHETSVKYKVPSPIGAEIEYAWWGWKKVNSYIKFHIDVFFHFWDVHDVEVVREGKKQKMQHARLHMEITGRCELDWSNRFAGSKLMQALADFYDNYVIRKDVDTIYTDQLYYRLYKFQRLVKEYLDFETKESAFEDVW